MERLLVDSHEAEDIRVEGRAVELIRHNPKYFYKYVHSKAKIRSTVGPFSDGNALVCEPREKATLLKSQYESVFSTPKYSGIPIPWS